jgi:hypothetical protein
MGEGEDDRTVPSVDGPGQRRDAGRTERSMEVARLLRPVDLKPLILRT